MTGFGTKNLPTISQDKKPIAFYSRKLNPAQTRYTTTERELLSIVETLKEFRTMLLGYKIIVWTNHKNLTCTNFNTERVLRWRLVLEEYSPELRYIQGHHNVVPDALSRLPMVLPDTTLGNLADIQVLDTTKVSEELNLCAQFLQLSLAEEKLEQYPLSYAIVKHYQDADTNVQRLLKDNENYSLRTFLHSNKTYSLVVYNNKLIVVPLPLQKRAVKWYHEILCHPGQTRTEMTIGQHYYWKGMRTTIVDSVRKCGICQRTKHFPDKFGKLPVKSGELIPWHTLCIDLIGPYKLGQDEFAYKGGVKVKTFDAPILQCMTMIDPATGWFEIEEVSTKRADVIANVLETTWLTRYPLPTEIIADRGTEFMGECLLMVREEYGLPRKLITARNPQANAIIERCHQTLHNLVRTYQLHTKVKDEAYYDIVTGILNSVHRAINSTVHTTLQALPMQLVFGRDAFLPVSFQANWNYIANRKQCLIVQNNTRENNKRKLHVYHVGDQVLILVDPNRKHGGDIRTGPYTIANVYENGTIKLRKPKGEGFVLETWNIRNLRPYHKSD